ncbi:MAG TPA: FAD-dependent oxidoreductase, partial [Acetobacteraceae bacterium]
MNTDLVVVGAGPAGLSAAIEATARGLSVVLLDENRGPGGRIWQALESRGAADATDAAGLRIIRQFRASGATAHWQATVWAIEPDGTVFWSRQGAAHAVRGRYVLLATGATERSAPIPGWTLPGVMTVGAAQIALKSGGLVPDANTWIAGQGPLLLLYAVQALRAGGRVAGILDLSDPAGRWGAAWRLPAATRSAGALLKGLGWRREIARAGIPWLRASDVRAEGEDRLQRIGFRTAGVARTEPADLLLLHDGVIPSMQMPRAAGCAQEWNAAQRCWQPAVDAWGTTSIAN